MRVKCFVVLWSKCTVEGNLLRIVNVHHKIFILIPFCVTIFWLFEFSVYGSFGLSFSCVQEYLAFQVMQAKLRTWEIPIALVWVWFLCNLEKYLISLKICVFDFVFHKQNWYEKGPFRILVKIKIEWIRYTLQTMKSYSWRM